MKVAIIGTVPASKAYAPYDDHDWDIWGCSAGNRGAQLPRITAWFELHGVDDLKGKENASWTGEYFAWVNAQTWPVYMQEPNDLVPRASSFPIREMLRRYGQRARINLTSSIAHMILFAIFSEAEEIGIFGVDMAAPQEAYTMQKSGCLNLMLLAHELGIKVTVPRESCLASSPPLYGYAEATRQGRRLVVQKQIIDQNIAQLEHEIAAKTAELNQFRGAADQVGYVLRTFVDGSAGMDDVFDLDAAPALAQEAETVPVNRVGSVLVPMGPVMNGSGAGRIPRRGISRRTASSDVAAMDGVGRDGGAG